LKNNLSWMIGGAQGSGVDSSATAFGKACAYGGLHVFGKREYYSNIKGEHSYFQVRVSDRPIRSHLEPVDLLATFDAETVFRHALDVKTGGAIVYDQALSGTRVSEVPTIEGPVREALVQYLQGQGLGLTMGDILQAAAARGVFTLGVPFNQLLMEIAGKYEVDQISKIARMVNIMAVATSLGLVHYEFAPMERAVRDIFRAKAKVAEMNVLGARLAYDLAMEKAGDAIEHRLTTFPVEDGRLFILGNQAVALGKIAAGCRFQTYYPITPASDESEYLEANEVLDMRGDGGEPELAEGAVLQGDGKGSVLVMQTEDEIAAITMAAGSALTGTRAATSTSGPGFCLMMEGLGYAGINEIPLVVTLYQRCGPSTGMPTRHEQGDLRFALHAGHGDFPRIILASGDLQEAFYDVVRGFNYAERYQLPVIHLVDKALANSSGTIEAFDPDRLSIDRGLLIGNGGTLDVAEPYQRFKLTPSGISPRAVLGTPGTIFWNTGDEHDEVGHITEDPSLRVRMMDKRMGKLDLAAKEIPEADKLNYFGPKKPEALIVSWGSTKGAILDALDVLEAQGRRPGFLQLRLLHPFPTEAVARHLRRSKVRVGVEMNYGGQLAGIVREATGYSMSHMVLKYNGRPMSEDELVEALGAVLKGDAPKRMVLTRGA
jgi:2-oxoglutarate ferredoxin oxidoreductase subunit alpha